MAGGVRLVWKKIAVLFAALMLVVGIWMTALPTSAQATPGDPGPSTPGTWACDGADCKFLNPDGIAYTNAWVLDKGKWYYLGDDGLMARTSGEYTWYNETGIDEKWYRFSSSGAMVTGWVETDYGGDKRWMYYDPHGPHVESEARYINGAWYVFDDQGFMIADRTYSIDDKEYRLTASGKAHIGWYYDGSYWYYHGSDGAMYKVKWLSQNGKWYYFQHEGRMVANNWIVRNAKRYQFDATGALITGARWEQDGSEWRYYGADGASYSRQWLYYGGKWYYFFSNYDEDRGYTHHRMARNELVEIDGKWYYFDQSGAMLSNRWHQLGNSADEWRYFGASGAVHSGWLLDKGKWYYLDPADENRMVNLAVPRIGNAYYEFDASGAWTGRSYAAGEGLPPPK
ncbi:MAG: hypothetical protein GX483_03705 [Actinomycetaceae bacterium]|nr:hypothetical protein [Actinomycetaceae bacterium]